MAFEEIGKPRYSKSNSEKGFIITIPSKKNWFIILFLGFWLIGWAVGEISVIGILSAGLLKAVTGGIPDALTAGAGAFSGLFMVAWLGGWTVGGAFAIYAWLWQVKGYEKITISHDGFKVEKNTPIWTRSKEYRIQDVVYLRMSSSNSSIWSMSGGMELWGITGGQLAFDYGAKTIRFGIGLDEAEAKQILKEIQAKHPDIIKEKA